MKMLQGVKKQFLDILQVGSPGDLRNGK